MRSGILLTYYKAGVRQHNFKRVVEARAEEVIREYRGEADRTSYWETNLYWGGCEPDRRNLRRLPYPHCKWAVQ